MNSFFWLIRRELGGRRMYLLCGFLMACVMVLFFMALEMTLKAREQSVRQDIDQVGPPLIVIAYDKTFMDLRRFDLGDTYFDRSFFQLPVFKDVLPLIRMVDPRLIVHLSDNAGISYPVIGLDSEKTVSPHNELKHLKPHEVILGSALAWHLNKKAGDVIAIGKVDVVVKAILDSSGDADDTTLFMPLTTLWSFLKIKGGINEFRIFPKSSEYIDVIGAKLKRYNDQFNVIEIDRGEVAETKIDQSLSSNRHIVRLILAAILAISMMIWAYLDAGERDTELATILAIGGRPILMVGFLLGRTIIVSALGALAGIGICIGYKIVVDGSILWNIYEMSAVIAVSLGGALFFSMLGASPVALHLMVRNNVLLLQN